MTAERWDKMVTQNTWTASDTICPHTDIVIKSISISRAGFDTEGRRTAFCLLTRRHSEFDQTMEDKTK